MSRTEPRPAAPLPPVALTPEEAAAVAVALAAGPDGPYAADGRTALEKVLEVLEPDPRRRAQLLATSLWVSAEADRSEQVRALLEQAVTRRRVLVLRYRDRQDRASRREVEPQALVRSSEHWFLVAWCRERQAMRWFRLDRVESAETTDEAAPRRDLTDVGAPPASRHPAGRALRTPPAPTGPPRLVVLPGGRT
ncbi:helix-turn-helix transcriptional regulator [Blastococcus sp. PRF04-17]|uniref:helix-turn-helix transcriptional regulator n=1 Tax=Blastococcus sp. PRF04-17 TaxID=2933797 RepID=UPI001FF36C58|nr:WYL domain-containing protein [Blastococcus sp. PRF04-17]UOY03285.1 WYL domain-containing protein [Blastococcus sp. PRF04-17]